MPKVEEKLKKGEIKFKSSEKLLALKWCNKREVWMLSTCHTAKLSDTGKKGHRQGCGRRKDEDSPSRLTARHFPSLVSEDEIPKKAFKRRCAGCHPVYARECPRLQEEKKITEIKVTEKISYADARKKYREMVNPTYSRYCAAVATIKRCTDSCHTDPWIEKNAKCSSKNGKKEGGRG
ncbi:hypothetical protein J437_LFUL012162 [Ladona fulva]|uniref:Uncharacterized protein n=1 Tax=Ladona fulva TaxID=123851 RepID=A0A8K0KCG3_LADFU|nr:hypothetical protein J437_LFUL012162 [Ladona fulva]